MPSQQERCSRVPPRSSLVPAAPACRDMESAEALRPAAALPAALVGRDPHGYYDLSGPVPALVISRPILMEAGSRFRRCSRCNFGADVGALSIP
jgi:hypothetical protein